MITIEDFWRMNEDIISEYGSRAHQIIDPCGLIPDWRSEVRYDSTPVNSKTFAYTGGDGVHFGIVSSSTFAQSIQPVVMTVPMNPACLNVIIAENLEEFFSIGYHSGWYFLEEISYNPDNAIANYAKIGETLSDEEFTYLQIIRNRFNILPLELTRERLIELKDKYFEKLDLKTKKIH